MQVTPHGLGDDDIFLSPLADDGLNLDFADGLFDLDFPGSTTGIDTRSGFPATFDASSFPIRATVTEQFTPLKKYNKATRINLLSFLCMEKDAVSVKSFGVIGTYLSPVI